MRRDRDDLPAPPKRAKARKPYQRTSAAAISCLLAKHGQVPSSVRSDVMGGRWVIVVNCIDMMQTNRVWARLRQGGYNMAGQFNEWIFVEEHQGGGGL